MGKRAKGRSLSEFSPLNVAEQRILEAAAAGDLAEIGETRPETESDTNTVRADFLRFLALGGDDEAPVHETGLHVQGAWITGSLDLSYAEIAGALMFLKCWFEAALLLFDAQIRGLFSLSGSQMPEMRADRLTCLAGVSLRAGFTSIGEVSLVGATVGGDLSCSKSTFENRGGRAIIADRLKVGGSAFMDDGFKAQGEIRFSGATISGNLVCTKGTFENPGGSAICADSINVGGNVYMNDRFSAQGEIRLLGATVGGDIYFRGGNFGSSDKDARAINGQGLTVSRALIFDDVAIDGGSVDLHTAHVAHLVDDLNSWPENLILDGFVYDSFAGNAPTTAKARLAWLDKQRPEHSGKAKNPREFRPQPWQQLRKVLRDMGHLEDARQIAIAFENRKRFCGVIGEITAPAAPGDIVTCFRQWLQSRTARGFHWLYGAVIGYGYRPARLFRIVVLVWIFSTVLFDIGGHSRVFAPSDPQIFENAAYDSCNPEKNPRANWTRCQTFPPAYPGFYPPLYALDVLLPIAKLGQEDHWAPLAPGRALTAKNRLLAWSTQFAVWFDIAFGWIAGLLLVATLSGLAKRSDE